MGKVILSPEVTSKMLTKVALNVMTNMINEHKLTNLEMYMDDVDVVTITCIVTISCESEE